MGLAALALLGACSNDGDDLARRAISVAEATSVFELDTGTCFNSADLADSGQAISEIAQVPCTDPHRFEVVATAVHPAAATEDFPGEDRLSDFSIERCTELFASALGRPYEAAADLEIVPLRPSSTSWTNSGDRTIHCVVYPIADVLAVRSLLPG